MNIRPATIADIDRCKALDASYETEFVWQMNESVEANSIDIRFERARIPRRTTVRYPRDVDTIYEDWQREECFLVADEMIRILGYLDMVVSHWRWQAWIEHLVVDRPYRRCGIASRLMDAAERWARGSELSGINCVVQSRNDPAICLLTKRGYLFRGFIDHYYTNGDIGLVYTLDL
ncbi:MAG: GNAT family N-acetyltransferase [Anaerolineae bacterium]|jgi:GNAT superfamily N-acetyltransferase